jgi:hypothetical protein
MKPQLLGFVASCLIVGLLHSPAKAEETSAVFPVSVASGNSATGEVGRCDSTDGCASTFCPCECRPRTECYFSAEALFLNLDPGTHTAIPVALNQDTGATMLSTYDSRFSTAAGPRLTFGYNWTECTTLEVVYFGIQHWGGGAEVQGDNNLRLPGDIALATLCFFDADRMSVTTKAELHNVELNYIRRIENSNVSLLVGFRYMDLNDSFDIHSYDVDSNVGDYDIHAKNNLFGAQIGCLLRKQFGKFGFDFVEKAGIYGNAASQSTCLHDFNDTYTLRDSKTNGSHAAFIGELGINGYYQVTKRLNVKAGYNLMWIEGVARSASQLDYTDTPESGTALVFGKGAFVHGANVGLELRW